MDKKCDVGGQALIEGVMMKNGDKVGIAVRKPSGKIKVKSETVKSWTKKKVLGWPFIRGIIILGEMLALGFRALDYSAKEALEEEDKVKNSKFDVVWTVVILLFSLGLAILMFKFVPLWIAQLFKDNLIVFGNKYLFGVVEGLVKLGVLIGYVSAIGLMHDVKRTFMYHGAEHKVVNCYEKENEVSIEKTRKYSTIHPRCGTSFIFLVIFISIVFYIFIPLGFNLLTKLVLRLAVLPLIAGVSYEILKLSGKYRNWVLQAFISPGLFLQKLTTREPDDKQLEVAIAAFKKVI